jgi:hypothetical protein
MEKPHSKCSKASNLITGCKNILWAPFSNPVNWRRWNEVHSVYRRAYGKEGVAPIPEKMA